MDKASIVEKVLLTEIQAYTRRNRETYFGLENGRPVIYTCMRYISPGSKSSGSLDEDVSKFSIGFYECLYDHHEILGEDRRPKSIEFIGDTMVTLKELKEDTDFPYHCLANFWMLPFNVGRTFGEFCKARFRDEMDRFLADLKTNYDKYSKEYPEYFAELGRKFNAFVQNHYLTGSFVSTDIAQIDADAKLAKELIKKRARAIAGDEEMASKLYDCFGDVNSGLYISNFTELEQYFESQK